MTEIGELTRRDIVIDPDMNIEDDGKTITAYIETWFDTDQKFGVRIAEEPETWINFYASYNVETGGFETLYEIDRPEGSEWHSYSATENEKHLIITMMDECCHTHYGCSLVDYVHE